MGSEANFLHNYSSRKIRYFPRVFFLSYFVFTLFMFSVSPWDWPLNSPVQFYLYNFFILICFYFGYRRGASGYSFKSNFQIDNIKLLSLVKYSILLNMIFMYPKFLFQLRVGSASPDFIIKSILTGLFTPELAYAEKHEAAYEGFLTLSSPLVLGYTIALPLLYLTIPLGIFFWERLKSYQKVFFIIILITDILSFIAIGTNKGIFDIILITPWLVLAKNPIIYLGRKFSFKKYRTVIFFIIVLGVGLAYFAQGNKGRKQENFYYEKSTGKQANLNSPVLVVLPKAFHNAYLATDSYLTQGYYALGLALELEFRPTYGLGHSFFLTSIGEKFLGKNYISDKTYEARMDVEYGWGQFSKWHSFYVSFANDFSFVGVLVLVYFISYFFAQAWLDVIGRKNIVSIPLFCLFLIMLFYFPANNQVLGFQGSSIVFWVLFTVWRFSRNKNSHLKRLRGFSTI